MYCAQLGTLWHEIVEASREGTPTPYSRLRRKLQ